MFRSWFGGKSDAEQIAEHRAIIEELQRNVQELRNANATTASELSAVKEELKQMQAAARNEQEEIEKIIKRLDSLKTPGLPAIGEKASTQDDWANAKAAFKTAKDTVDLINGVIEIYKTLRPTYYCVGIDYDNPVLNDPQLLEEFSKEYGTRITSNMIDLTCSLSKTDVQDICNSSHPIANLALLVGISPTHIVVPEEADA